MDDHTEQFKTPIDQFTKELDALEDQYSNGNNVRDTIARMSLFKQFDPLVAISKSQLPQQTTAVIGDELTDPSTTATEEHFNQSCTLIHINTPSSKQAYYENNTQVDDFNKNGHLDINEMHYEENISQTINNLENMELVSHATSITEQLCNLVDDHLQSLQQQLVNSQKEEERLNSIKNDLSEELNNVEKNYYDTHSRYENLKSVFKEINAREAASKEKIHELALKLKDKDQECRKWKQVAEETIENTNQRLQNATNKESISLKAQIKVLEMRVNSLQSQIEQKNRENEELTHIVDELIGKKN